jgi:hypothetical protein
VRALEIVEEVVADVSCRLKEDVDVAGEPKRIRRGYKPRSASGVIAPQFDRHLLTGSVFRKGEVERLLEEPE